VVPLSEVPRGVLGPRRHDRGGRDPVGTFVELEGSEEGILAAAAALGRAPADFIVDSYRTLFLRHTAGATGEMVFPTS